LVFEDHEYNPSFADPPIDHAAYTDPRKLDRTEPEAILRPYPELWSHWQSEMDRADVYDEYCSGGIFRMHSARFLRDVVRQHVWLTEGPGDTPPLPAFAERIATLLAQAPASYVEMRHEFLISPWKRALKRDYIRLYNLPDYVERSIKTWERQLDPNYELTAEHAARQRALNAIFNGSVAVREVGRDRLIAQGSAAANQASRRTASSN